MHDLPWGQLGQFWKGNLHAHSNLSDGVLPLDEVIAGYRRQGYDFLAVTEHFNEEYGYAVLDTTTYRTDDFTTLIGAELEGPELEIGGIWYLNAIGLPL